MRREQVVRAALDEFRENGIGGVSFRSVSRRLGVNPMALYTYVADKDELLSAMYDHVLAEAGSALPAEPGDPGQALTAFFTASYRLMVEYAGLARLVRPTLDGVDLDIAERVHRLLVELGVAEERVAEVQMALQKLTIGSALVADIELPPVAEADAGPDHPLVAGVLRRLDDLHADAEGHFLRTFGLLLEALVDRHQPR
ncbi:hypothetical protein BBK82_42075 [Lentzea guizhouensis]|uniref:HTH tetR-type domain-containing protein n=1 Tax=Lentzea guizhouensis TaxID=1586287 RepID=A0A1B2HV38_9PSEU|nr:hypothetical protein BBK82_42075 [Lentzea guizhouensis]